MEITVDEYIAMAVAFGCSNPAVARAEWEALQADSMLSLIDARVEA